MYTIEGLEHGIERCKVNIASLEKGIEKERNTIKDYRIMIDDIEQAAKQKKEAQENVHLEIIDGGKE